jgi:hypothetical protein
MQVPPDAIFCFTSKQMLLHCVKFALYDNFKSYFSMIHFNYILHSIPRFSDQHFLLISYFFHQSPTHIICFALTEVAMYHLLGYLALIMTLINLWQWSSMTLNEVRDSVEYRSSQASKFLHKLQFSSFPPTSGATIAGSNSSKFDFHKMRDDLPGAVMVEWPSGKPSRNPPRTKRMHALSLVCSF